MSDPINRKLAWNSFLIGLLTATVTVLIGLPIAYWLRFVAQRSRLTVLFLIIASMFASYLVRIYAWRTVLGSNGLINDGLIRLGIIDQPLDFLLFNRFAVTVALVHIFLPYVVLVLYASMAPMSSNLLELGQDLGAGPSLIWRRVILPIMAAPHGQFLRLRFHSFCERLRRSPVSGWYSGPDARCPDSDELRPARELAGGCGNILHHAGGIPATFPGSSSTPTMAWTQRSSASVVTDGGRRSRTTTVVVVAALVFLYLPLAVCCAVLFQ
ncbi:MAG: ABC transporter permease [Nocardioidaceae bacterium]